MRITQLQLQNFRNYTEELLTFPAGVTTLVGRNGQGKTNLVEAIYYLSTLSSHRVSSDLPLIKAGADNAIVRGKIEKAERALVLEVILGAPRRRARIGNKEVPAREVAGILRTVIFAPEDLQLVKGDPESRRRFVDDLVQQVFPRMQGDYADYARVLKQRTSLLKTAKLARQDLSTLDFWDEKLADLGAQIVAMRLQILSWLAPFLAAAYLDVSAGNSTCSATYISSWWKPSALSGAADISPRLDVAEAFDTDAIRQQLFDEIRALRPKEVERGLSLVGPHRDDIEFRVNSLPAKGYASHGESWSIALALKLACYDFLVSDTAPDAGPDGEPVLILDDVFAELDSYRRAALAARVEQASQVIITAAVPEDVPKNLVGHTISISGGAVAPELE